MHVKTAEAVTGAITEIDPAFVASLANGITGTDTTYWNNKQEQITAGTNITLIGNTISSTLSAGFTHNIGDEFGGGIIFHLWRDNVGIEHGLIVDKTDLSTSQNFSNVGMSMQGGDIWNGLGNCNTIISQVGHTSSGAALCLNSTNGGQSDWYLPSIKELQLLWNNYHTVRITLAQISGATQMGNIYWSSVEIDATKACQFLFTRLDDTLFEYGYAMEMTKSTSRSVRAIRAF
jgi:hypothetical protein